MEYIFGYPLQLNGQDCQTYNQTIYCVGGWNGVGVTRGAFYYSLNMNNTVTSTIQTTTIPESIKTTTIVKVEVNQSITTTPNENNSNRDLGLAFGIVLVLVGIFLFVNSLRKNNKIKKRKR